VVPPLTAILPLRSLSSHHSFASLLQTLCMHLPHCTQSHPKANMLEQTDTPSNRTLYNSAAHSLQALNTNHAPLYHLISQAARMRLSIHLSLPFPNLDDQALPVCEQELQRMAASPYDVHATRSWMYASRIHMHVHKDASLGSKMSLTAQVYVSNVHTLVRCRQSR
jgi:hypothetical protein